MKDFLGDWQTIKEVSLSNTRHVNPLEQLVKQVLIRRPARINGIDYPTIQNAYSNSSTGAIIQILGLEFTEDLDFDQDKSITLQGGYECTCIANPITTIINGKITVSRGTVTIEKIVII